ncbi:MAG TPA: twin-arginine translocase TatA/TatE family subunit [Solirubrobacteraceae bacterium]|nr:twin-arginine translocase TatA/TatE family subunit [Solirubrobacteraceae bacterium]
MGIDNPVHLAFIAIVALLVLGPKRLPELARALGHGVREFREAIAQPDAHPLEPGGGSAADRASIVGASVAVASAASAPAANASTANGSVEGGLVEDGGTVDPPLQLPPGEEPPTRPL